MVAVDLNGDLRPDLIVSVDGGFAVLLNKGNGTFLPSAVYSTGGIGARAIVSIDLNRDGRPDIVALTERPATLHILLNRGDGTFLTDTPFVLGGYYINQTMAAGDFNGDGRTDVVVSYLANDGSAVNAIYANQGDGSLALLSKFSAPPVNGLYVGDLNRDGLADILVNTGNDFAILLNLGAGRMSAPVTYPTGQPTRTVYYIADMNGDGLPDVVMDEQYHAFDVSRNLGGGIFSPPSLNYPGSYFYGYPLALGDFNNDGSNDVVAIGDIVLNFSNNGNGTFLPPNQQPYGGTNPAFDTAVADFDGDGLLDFAVLSFGTKVYVFHNTTAVAPSRLTVKGVFPDHGGNAGVVTAVVAATGLLPGATAKLTGLGPDIIGRSAASATGALTATFNLAGSPPGPHTIVVMNTDGTSASLFNGFTVEQGGSPDVWVDLIGRTVARGGQTQVTYLEYGNRGNVDSPATRLWITFPSYFTLAGSPSMTPVFSGLLEGVTYMAFDVIPVTGSSGAIVIRLIAPSAASFAHQAFQLQAWEEVR